MSQWTYEKMGGQRDFAVGCLNWAAMSLLKAYPSKGVGGILPGKCDAHAYAH